QPRRVECWQCGGPHYKSSCPNVVSSRSYTGSCYICGAKGHKAYNCPKRYGGPGESGQRSSGQAPQMKKKNGKGKGRGNASNTGEAGDGEENGTPVELGGFSSVSNDGSIVEVDELWFFDSGCSVHMTNNPTALIDPKPVVGSSVTVGDGKVLQVSAMSN
ncbi:unnamed protein product, partial [Ectocarpus sp. 12 AP-2014]